MALRSVLGTVLVALVSVGGFLYYLIFGAKTLDPSIHRDLTSKRLLELFREAFSFGKDGAAFVLSDETTDELLQFRKDIRSVGDVRLVWTQAKGVTRDDARELAERVLGGPLTARDHVDSSLELEIGVSADAAAELAERALKQFFGRDLSAGVRFHATGITLTANNGWSARR